MALAVAQAAAGCGWDCVQVPLSDGGEGFCEVLGGRARVVAVHGPLGDGVDAEWRLLADGRTAVVETALASGLTLVGGPSANDAVRASSAGTGELIAAAVAAGARRVLVGMGGSATTDGGYGALEALEPHSRLRGVELLVACDVTTRFVDAARVFAPQKGATPAQVELLTRRLQRLVGLYSDRFGVDVGQLPGAGAAGGLAGGLAALGATLVPGFDLVADVVDLASHLERADLVVTGEGTLDEQSFEGKSVGGVIAMASSAGVPVLVVAGDAVVEAPVPVVSLVDRFGAARSLADAAGCVREVVAAELAAGRPGRP